MIITDSRHLMFADKHQQIALITASTMVIIDITIPAVAMPFPPFFLPTIPRISPTIPIGPPNYFSAAKDWNTPEYQTDNTKHHRCN